MVPQNLSAEADKHIRGLQDWMQTHNMELDKPASFKTFCSGLFEQIKLLPKDKANLKSTSKAVLKVISSVLDSISLAGFSNQTRSLKNLDEVANKLVSPAGAYGFLVDADAQTLIKRIQEIREALSGNKAGATNPNVLNQNPTQTAKEKANADALKDTDKALKEQFADLEKLFTAIKAAIAKGIPDYTKEFTVQLAKGPVKYTNVYYAVTEGFLKLESTPTYAALKAAAGSTERTTSLAKDDVTKTWEKYQAQAKALLAKVEDSAAGKGLVYDVYKSDPRVAELLQQQRLAAAKKMDGSTSYAALLKALRTAVDKLEPGLAKMPEPFDSQRSKDVATAKQTLEQLELNEWLYALPPELATLKQKSIRHTGATTLSQMNTAIADLEPALAIAESYGAAQRFSGGKKDAFDVLIQASRTLIDKLKEAVGIKNYLAGAKELQKVIDESRKFDKTRSSSDIAKQIDKLEEEYQKANAAKVLEMSGKPPAEQDKTRDLKNAYTQALELLNNLITVKPTTHMDMGEVLREFLPKLVPTEERMLELNNRYYKLMGENSDPYRDAVWRGLFGLHYVEIKGDSGSKAFDITYDEISPELVNKTVRFAGLARALFLIPPTDAKGNVKENLTVEMLDNPNLTKINEDALDCYFYIVDRIKGKYGGIQADPRDPTDRDFSYNALVGDNVNKFVAHLAHKFPRLAKAKNLIGTSMLEDMIRYSYATGAKSVGYAPWLARETTRSHGSTLALAQGKKLDNEMGKAAPFAEGVYSRGRYGNNIMNQTGEDFLFMSKEVAQRIQPGGELLGKTRAEINHTIHTAEEYWKIYGEGWKVYLSQDYWKIMKMSSGAKKDAQIAEFLKKYSEAELTDAFLRIMFLPPGAARETAWKDLVKDYDLKDAGNMESFGKNRLRIEILSESAARAAVSGQQSKERQFAAGHRSLGDSFEEIAEKLPYGGPVFGKVAQLEKIITAGEMWDLVDNYRERTWGSIPAWVKDMRRMIGIDDGTKLDLYETWMPLIGEVVPRCMEIEREKRKILAIKNATQREIAKTNFIRKYKAQGYGDNFDKIGLATLNDESLDLAKYNVNFRSMDAFTNAFQTEPTNMSEEAIMNEWKDWMDKVIGKIKLVPGPHHYMFGPQTMRMLSRLVLSFEHSNDHFEVENLILEMMEQMQSAGGLPGHVKEYVLAQVLDNRGRVQNIRQFIYEPGMDPGQTLLEKAYYGKLIDVKQKHKSDWRAWAAKKAPLDWFTPKPANNNFLVRPWNFKEKKKESSDAH